MTTYKSTIWFEFHAWIVRRIAGKMAVILNVELSLTSEPYQVAVDRIDGLLVDNLNLRKMGGRCLHIERYVDPNWPGYHSINIEPNSDNLTAGK